MPTGQKYRITGEHFYRFFQCPHWIWYDLYGDQSKRGSIPPLMEMIYRDGLKHEKNVMRSRTFEEIKPESFKDLDEAFLATVELMKQGKNIYHGVLMDQHWVGIPDLLEARPLERGMKSNFDYSPRFGEAGHYYVIYDVKSGHEIKDEYKFQLVYYSLILERIQGILPREAYIINADGEERSFVIDEFLDYFHLTLERIERILSGEKPPPFLKSGCKQSPWYALCLEDTKGCDDISLIYRLSQNDQRRLYDIGIHTVKDLATVNLEELSSHFTDWPFDKIVRFYNQANVLISNEPLILKKPEFPFVSNEIYFDVESDPTDGVDYLLGALVKKSGKTDYVSFWADDKKDEVNIWREFLNFVESLEDFVVYHYSNYERLVFQRLANRYGISIELENKFTNNAVDLHRIVVESVVLPLYFYSLKDIAQYLGFKWRSDDAGGAESVVWYNEWLTLGKHNESKGKAQKIKKKIIEYNEDDVCATMFVKEWLEKQHPKTQKEKLD